MDWADVENESRQPAALYTMASRTYFESPERIEPVGDYGSALRRHLPENWVVTAWGIWYRVQPPGVVLPSGGFKLHVSATLENARRVLGIVASACVDAKVTFKVVRAANLLALANSKVFPRAAAHKFITVYPAKTEIFSALAASLAARTRGLAGPHILSDRPVDGSRTLFYRFGAFAPQPRLTIQGTREMWIEAPNGTWIRDRRVPYFRLPPGVADPFSKQDTSAEPAEVLLNERYEVEQAIAFSTCGGTYVAKDRRSGEQVLIKEARPLTVLSHDPKHVFLAAEGLVREQRILQKLSRLTCVPKHIECFEQGGHHFSVQQFLAARPFRQYRAREEISLAPFDGEAAAAGRFCKAFRTLAANMIDCVWSVHRLGVIVGDLSPDNILVDDAQRTYLIDFASSWDTSWAKEADDLTTLWMTPGFRRPGTSSQAPAGYADDWFALGTVLFSMLLPVERLTAVLPTARQTFTRAIMGATRLPAWIGAIIEELVSARPARARELLRCTVETRNRGSTATRTADAESCAVMSFVKQVRHTVAATAAITDDLLATYDVKRSDRLWPSDYKVFETNPLSIAYGACGPLLFLERCGVAIPDDIRRWVLQKPLTLDAYPPGLYLGLAGIAYTLWQLGCEDRAAEALTLAFESDLLYSDWGMFLGASGCGLAALQMYLWTHDDRFVRRAIEVGTQLLRNAIKSERGLAWVSATRGEPATGYAHGGSGIALFLLYLGLITSDRRFLFGAKQALEHELASSMSGANPQVLRWRASPQSNIWSPYWLHGGSGIGSVVVRFYRELADARYLDLAQRIGRSNYSRCAVLPAQFEGLSGLGEFMLDLGLLKGGEEFAARAAKIADNILLYKVPRARGATFPGRFLVRLSSDHGYGSSGVGLFLSRFLHRDGRPLHDLQAWSRADGK
jgi:class III lanthionine synthetase